MLLDWLGVTYFIHCVALSMNDLHSYIVFRTSPMLSVIGCWSQYFQFVHTHLTVLLVQQPSDLIFMVTVTDVGSKNFVAVCWQTWQIQIQCYACACEYYFATYKLSLPGQWVQYFIIKYTSLSHLFQKMPIVEYLKNVC